MKTKFFFCFFIFLFCQGFSFQTKESDKSLPFKVYEIPFEAMYCYFSPLDDGKIWLTNNDTSQEFDPVTGKFTNLTSRLGDFSAGIVDRVFRDEYNKSLVWICSFRKGLIIYDKPKGTSVKYPSDQYFNKDDITFVKPEKEQIWISTWNGIYRMNRSDWKIEQIVKTKIWTNNIQRLEPDEIIFGRIDESYQSSNWFKFKISTKELMEIPSPELPNRVTQILEAVKPRADIKTNDIYEIDDDTDVVWFINNFGLGQIDKKTGIIKYVDLGCQDMYLSYKNHAVLVGTNTLWVRCSKKLIAIDKNKISGIIMNRTDIEEKIRKIRDLDAELYHEQSPVMFFKKMITIIYLYNDAYKLDNKAFESVFGPKQTLIDGLCHRNLTEIERYLQINSTDTVIAPFLLWGLFCGYSLDGNPKQALDYYEMLVQKYPTHKILKYIRPEDIQTLRNGSKELNIIKAKNLPPDQKLWELGQAYMRMMQVDWNMAEVGYHMNHPYSFFNEIIKNFPNSTYADNAWWTMKFGYEDWEGDYDMFFLNTMLSKYKEFLARYPSSELAPLAKYLISSDILRAVKYAEENPTIKDILPPDKRGEYLDTAKQMCSEAIQGGMTKKDTLGYSITPDKKLIEIDKYIEIYKNARNKLK